MEHKKIKDSIFEILKNDDRIYNKEKNEFNKLF
jgi:hypothetical protein